MKLSKNFFKNFLFSEMHLSAEAILAYEQKQKFFEMPPKAILNLYGVSFICTNFEAFTTFSAIFTRICRTRLEVKYSS